MTDDDYATAEERWAAVVARAAAADGRFVFSVATTGVYCRPGCGARTPRRENVTFHADGAAARAAGFRACRRCRPDEPPLALRHASVVAAACRAIEAAEEMPSLTRLAAAAGFSPHHFHRMFRAVTGLTPRAYAAGRRAQAARDALSDGASVTQAIHAAGFGAPSRFYENSTEILGMQPSDYRAGGAGETIRHAIAATSLGAMLVAATARGVCAVLLGDDPAMLVDDLRRRFPQATLVGGDEELARTVALAVAGVERPGGAPALPLDVRGTAFQRQVWQALRAIPPGATVSYAELADRIGRPGATRAVAQACGANPVAVAIPCHRVVRADGGLSGYRWGVERKRELLRREREGDDA